MLIFIFSDNTANTTSSRNWAKQGSWEMEKTRAVKESGAGQVPNGAGLHPRRSAGAAPAGGCAPRCSCRGRELSRVLVGPWVWVTSLEDRWKHAAVGTAATQPRVTTTTCQNKLPWADKERTYILIYLTEAIKHLRWLTSRSHNVRRPWQVYCDRACSQPQWVTGTHSQPHCID